MRFLTLIFGTMASGKTSELLDLIDDLLKCNSRLPIKLQESFTVFKPAIETRDPNSIIRSRNGCYFDEAIAVSNIRELSEHILENDPDVIFIDECHFFEFGDYNSAEAFVLLIKELLSLGKRVILSGLIQNCYGGKFEILSELCPEADAIINPHTLCECGKIASRNQRLQNGYPTPITDPIIVVDDGNSHDSGYSYEPRCNDCWKIPKEANPQLILFRNILEINLEA